MISFFSLQEDHPIMSFTLDDTGRQALVNVSTQVNMRNKSQVITLFSVILLLIFCIVISLSDVFIELILATSSSDCYE